MSGRIDLPREFSKLAKEYAAFGDGVPAACVAALCANLAERVERLERELDIACARIQTLEVERG